MMFFTFCTLFFGAVLFRTSGALVVITAPSTVIEENAGLETREEGQTTWICSVLVPSSPWTAYASLRSYLEGGNAEGKDYTDLVLYPVMELYHDSDSRLCVYLPSVDHCYPPSPTNNQVMAVKRLFKKIYYDMRFWGQASNIRVEYYKQKLIAALDAQSKSAKLDIFFVSYFSDHTREVRYDNAPMTRAALTPPAAAASLACPSITPETMASNTTLQAAGQQYSLMMVDMLRLTLFDVRTRTLPRSSAPTPEDCATVASNDDMSAFSFVDDTCKLYDFGPEFCPCITGDFEVYVNWDRYGEKRELAREPSELEGLERVVAYTTFEVADGQARGSRGETTTCETNIRDNVNFVAAYIKNRQCFVHPEFDVYTCNQTCRGIPVNVMRRKVDLYRNPTILSLCGQTLDVKQKFEGRNHVNLFYFSHEGMGCYPYPEATTPEQEDCLVNFQMLEAHYFLLRVYPINLNRDTDTSCHDTITIYNATDRSDTRCAGIFDVNKRGKYFQINFKRKMGEPANRGQNSGFMIRLRVR